MAEIQATNNNLITQTLNNQIKTNNTNKVENNISTPKTENRPDSFEKTNTPQIITPKGPSKGMQILNGVISTALMLGLFFLPDLIFARKANNNGILNKYKKFKPVIGEFVTSQRQDRLKNGNLKITLENIKDKFKYQEIIIGNPKGNIIQRILIKKEEMPNGKYITRFVKSYKGKNLANNAEIDKNEHKYLFKLFRRSKIQNKEYRTLVQKQGEEPKFSRFYTTSNGKPVLRIQENEAQKENMAFLYAGDKCIGTDTQIIPKNNPDSQYNVLTIPSANIRNKKYDPSKETKPYDTSLLKKFMENF